MKRPKLKVGDTDRIKRTAKIVDIDKDTKGFYIILDKKIHDCQNGEFCDLKDLERVR